jgi:hypothetical protein
MSLRKRLIRWALITAFTAAISYFLRERAQATR